MPDEKALPGSAGALAGGGEQPTGGPEAGPGSAGALAGGEKPPDERPEDGPADFIAIFGPKPRGGSFAQKRKLFAWELALERWGGIMESETLALMSRTITWREPDGTSITRTVGWRYSEIGMGLPLIWMRKDGAMLVAFPQARYSRPTSFSAHNVVEQSGTVWRTWQIDSVQAGFYVEDLNPNFPASLLAQNQENKARMEA